MLRVTGRALVGLLVVAFVLAIGRGARAETSCRPSSAPVVHLVLEVRPPDMIIGETLERHLRSELEAREIDLCTVPTAPRVPIARVTLHVEHPDGGPCIAVVTIRDALTNKVVERTLDLTKLPDDARPLAVAASADELLRASWSELHLVDAPPPAVDPPKAVVKALESTTRPPPPRPKAFEMAALTQVSRFFSRRTGIGGGLMMAWWVARPFGLFARFSTAYGLSEPSVNGSVRADTTGLTLGTALAPVPLERPLGIRFEGGLSAVRASFEGSAASGAQAEGGSDWTAVASVGARAWIGPESVRGVLGANALLSLRPIRATDDGRTVVALQGFGAELSLGVLVPF